MEHLDRGLEVVVGHADHVEVLVPLRHHLLPLDGLAHADETVAQARRPLELELVGGLPHLDLEVAARCRRCCPRGSGGARATSSRVALVVDLADAGPRALLDVEQEARATQLLVPVELVVGARPQREGAQQEVERLADGVGVPVGAEVAHPLALGPPHDRGAGPLLPHRDGQERVALVVDEPHVEARAVALDEAVLEHERLDLVGHLDPLHRLGGGHHLRGARRQGPGILEVVREALPQRLGLADVDHPAGRVLELVGPRRIGDRSGWGALDHPLIVGRCWRHPFPAPKYRAAMSSAPLHLEDEVEAAPRPRHGRRRPHGRAHRAARRGRGAARLRGRAPQQHLAVDRRGLVAGGHEQARHEPALHQRDHERLLPAALALGAGQHRDVVAAAHVHGVRCWHAGRGRQAGPPRRWAAGSRPSPRCSSWAARCSSGRPPRRGPTASRRSSPRAPGW